MTTTIEYHVEFCDDAGHWSLLLAPMTSLEDARIGLQKFDVETHLHRFRIVRVKTQRDVMPFDAEWVRQCRG